MLHDPARLLRLLTDLACPVQLLIAGKAHPADQAGQELIAEWTRFIRESGGMGHAAFLEDYDMLLTERLVRGVDVWLNTPTRPWEASGTSGMKVLVNGGLNCSELDGWWAEAYSSDVGWALGDGREHGDDPAWDAAEAEALYDLLEREIVPAFYTRDGTGIPTGWVARMRESMARLTPRFSTNRVVREYVEEHYLPATATYRQGAADKGALGCQIVEWRNALCRGWAGVGFGALKVDTAGDGRVFEVEVSLGDLDPQSVSVELYADGTNGWAPVREQMTSVGSLVGGRGSYLYRATASAERPATDYTPRVVLRFGGVAVPLESYPIRWQR